MARQAAPRRQETQSFKDRYASRAGRVETISQAVFALDMRWTRYSDLSKMHSQHMLNSDCYQRDAGRGLAGRQTVQHDTPVHLRGSRRLISTRQQHPTKATHA
jgi:hypothetical protein